ncbi:TRAP transporter small permease subunit [Pseudooceanicola aestuarii]|uniref:TRAP transporter small permease subunit n=1 Tax=Pseudooceanicola aestuarii TaxID=2697319 RepID=UPI0013D55380|nr:TRAP transporter small permease [Pseudooceanicola aestuarii]
MSDPAQKVQGRAPLTTAFDEALRQLAHGMVLTAGAATLTMGLLVATDVLWRALSGRNLGGVDEIAGYLFAIGVSWSLASAFHARAHIRVDILYRKLTFVPRLALDISAMLSLLIVAGFLTYSSWLVLTTSWTRDAHSASSLQVPLVVPQAIWMLGILVFLAALLTALARSFADLLAGRAVSVIARHGVPTPDEEARDAVLQSRGDG